MTMILAPVKRVIKSNQLRLIEWFGQHIEKPISRSVATRAMKRLGHTGVILRDLDGESEIYTWAMIQHDGSPSHVIKTSPLFGIRPRWRVRKSTPLFDYITPRERVSLIIQKANSLYDAGYGSKPISKPGDRYSVIEWAAGIRLNEMPPGRQSIQAVVSAILDLDQLGFHHGDLHAGNVVITNDDRVLFIDADNQFAHHISGQTALAVDLAVLSGSLLALHGFGQCIEEKYTIATVISDSVGYELMRELSRAALDHRSENRWLQAAAKFLGTPTR